MTTVVYADIIFIINLIMNYLVFYISSKLSRRFVKKYRLFLASLISSLLYGVLVFTNLRQYYNFLTTILILCVGIFVAFGFKDIKSFFKLIIITHISAFVIGGIAIGLFFYTNLSSLFTNAINFTIEYFPFKLFLVLTGAIYIFLKFLMSFLNSTLKKQEILDVIVAIHGEEFKFPALLDTGNTLSDTKTGYPVIIVESSMLKINMQDLGTNIKLIPYKSVGEANGVLLGFIPERLEVSGVIKKDVIVAITELKLSQGEYKGLINPQVCE